MHATDCDLELFYTTHYPSLVEAGLSSNLPLERAMELAHEVLLASLLQLPRIENPAVWLQGSLRCAIAFQRAGA